MRIIFSLNIDMKSFIKIKNIVYSQQADQIKLIIIIILENQLVILLLILFIFNYI